jgi:hypothetical protein
MTIKPRIVYIPYSASALEPDNPSTQYPTHPYSMTFESGPGLLLVFMDLGDKVTEAEFHGK